MKMLIRHLSIVSVVTCSLTCFIFCGCGASSPVVPQKPLPSTIEGKSKFADRFRLEEEPQFFYDLFGDELLNSNKSSAELCGCGASNPTRQEPLLLSMEGQSFFSNRFQLGEEPQYFYNLFGEDLLKGNESSAEIRGKESLKSNRIRLRYFD